MYIFFLSKYKVYVFQYQREEKVDYFSSEVILQFSFSPQLKIDKNICAIFLERMTLISTVLFQIQL